MRFCKLPEVSCKVERRVIVHRTAELLEHSQRQDDDEDLQTRTQCSVGHSVLEDVRLCFAVCGSRQAPRAESE
jgi:hypothetical protein